MTAPTQHSSAPIGADSIEWVIFGDDWGGHPSTTQHLALHLPPTDRIVWVESIGMRAPKLNWVDVKRIAQKAGRLLDARAATSGQGLYHRPGPAVDVVSPRVLPWHAMAGARWMNARSLASSIGSRQATGWPGARVLLTSVPNAAYYLSRLRVDRVAYLRLDDYAHYPGVDPQLVEESEALMFERAQVVFATARRLLPPPPYADKGVYLPQGVNWAHFAQAPLEPSRDRVLGFFGTLSSWVDAQLIAAVARALPDWELRLVGKREVDTPELDRLDNVRITGAVPFAELPALIGDWAAAWIPFRINALTEAVNPLKVWEYLATGLATMSTPIPEVAAMVPRVSVSTDPSEIASWAQRVLEEDSAQARAARREGVRGDDWSVRAALLRDRVQRPEGGG
ncbi:MAG: glycosyltransferase [Gemmatimonadetes bacterium]|nr:glycosyltransferase [Gemmatimonadota bacterium]NNK64699.1 glycosyltransferase [Gemmatimonadota bacterium]